MGAELSRFNTSNSHSITKINSKQQWESKIQETKTKLMVVDFSATWCGPCKVLEPHLAEFARKYEDVLFVKVDVDEMHELALQWSVEALPTLVLIKDGKEVGRVVGAKKDELENKIMKFMRTY